MTTIRQRMTRRMMKRRMTTKATKTTTRKMKKRTMKRTKSTKMKTTKRKMPTKPKKTTTMMRWLSLDQSQPLKASNHRPSRFRQVASRLAASPSAAARRKRTKRRQRRHATWPALLSLSFPTLASRSEESRSTLAASLQVPLQAHLHLHLLLRVSPSGSQPTPPLPHLLQPTLLLHSPLVARAQTRMVPLARQHLVDLARLPAPPRLRRPPLLSLSEALPNLNHLHLAHRLALHQLLLLPLRLEDLHRLHQEATLPTFRPAQLPNPAHFRSAPRRSSLVMPTTHRRIRKRRINDLVLKCNVNGSLQPGHRKNSCGL